MQASHHALRLCRPRTRSSTSTDVSYPDEGQQGGSGCASAAMTDAGHPRRKIGRPIAYTGDPDAKHLTDSERRRIKRRAPGRPVSCVGLLSGSASVRRVSCRAAAQASSVDQPSVAVAKHWMLSGMKDTSFAA